MPVSSELNLDDAVDPDVDLRVPEQCGELVGQHGPVLGVIALGGGLGALGRYGLAKLMPTRPGHLPWGTFITNVLGCLLIGVLMVLITEVLSAHRLVRPFLGVGVLGGFTTFSTYAAEIDGLLRPDTIGLAFAYLVGTMITALLATLAGVWATRMLTRAGA
jgi:fluoride exporter